MLFKWQWFLTADFSQAVCVGAGPEICLIYVCFMYIFAGTDLYSFYSWNCEGLEQQEPVLGYFSFISICTQPMIVLVFLVGRLYVSRVFSSPPVYRLSPVFAPFCFLRIDCS